MAECRDINELHPKVKELALKLVEVCKQNGLNIAIGETYRTKERQNELYAQGRTKPGNIVTNARGDSMSSYHQWRLAFDIFNNKKGDEYNMSVLKKAGELGQKLGLEWGGSWQGFKDYPHFQYTFGLTVQDLKQGKKPPIQTIEENIKNQTYIEAVKNINVKGIISDVPYWSKLDQIKSSNIEILIKRSAGYLAGKTIDSYEEAVKVCVQKGVISEYDKWKDTSKVEVKYVESFIIKLSTK